MRTFTFHGSVIWTGLGRGKSSLPHLASSVLSEGSTLIYWAVDVGKSTGTTPGAQIRTPSRRCWVPLVGIQFSSVAQSCLTLCDPMNRSTPGLPVHHQLPEFTQTYIRQVGDAIQPSHPLSPPSPPAPNPSQHQSFPMSQLFA